MNNIVNVHALTKHFGERVAVDHLDLAIDQGQCLGLLGPNGAGKTTTINMLLGLVRPTSGAISVFGLPANGKMREIKQDVGVAPQSDNLDPDLTVMENLLVYASYFRIPVRKALATAEDLLGFFALGNRRTEIIQNLSGGQRRRLIIARALINRPRLLILDEPTIGLDPQARHLIWDRLEALKEKGTTMLLTSHYMEEVSRLADSVIIMDNGKVMVRGLPEKMISEMVGEEVYEITGNGEDLRAVVEQVKHCDMEWEIQAGRLYIYAKRPCEKLNELTLRHRHVAKRPANLEDLFLKLTGRRLVEA